MSKNQAKKETSAELSTRIASENKAKLDAKRVQQEFDRQERVANRNNSQLSNQTGAIMTDEALKAEIAQLKMKVNAQDVDLDKFGVMQTQYFANEKKWNEASKLGKEYTLAVLAAQKDVELQVTERAKINLLLKLMLGPLKLL
jgi:hypothetical protein